MGGRLTAVAVLALAAACDGGFSSGVGPNDSQGMGGDSSMTSAGGDTGQGGSSSNTGNGSGGDPPSGGTSNNGGAGSVEIVPATGGDGSGAGAGGEPATGGNPGTGGTGDMGGATANGGDGAGGSGMGGAGTGGAPAMPERVVIFANRSGGSYVEIDIDSYLQATADSAEQAEVFDLLRGDGPEFRLRTALTGYYVRLDDSDLLVADVREDGATTLVTRPCPSLVASPCYPNCTGIVAADDDDAVNYLSAEDYGIQARSPGCTASATAWELFAILPAP